MSNRIKCPACGTEFDIQNEKEWNGYHNCGASIPDMDMCVGTLIPSEKQSNKTANKGEVKMAENKGISTEEWVKEIMETQKKMMDLVVQKVANGENVASVPVSSSTKGGKAGKNSKFYGQELCGYAYSPYLVRRWLPHKFREWMKKYELNIDCAIKNEITIMESIKFCIEECENLVEMQKTDPIAYEERRLFWPVNDMKAIFVQYFRKVQDEIKQSFEDGEKFYNGNNKLAYIKFHNKKIPVTISIDTENKNTVYARPKLVITPKDWKLPGDIEHAIRQIQEATSYEDLYKIMSMQKLVKLQPAYIKTWKNITSAYELKSNKGYEDNTLSSIFIENYKKAGAFYTMQDDILFHDLSVNGFKGREANYYIHSIINLEAHKIYKIYKVALGYSAKNGRN
ncbi:MAG: hypothetical protein MJZ11_08185 [Lachnospiraceae bacterium]|nr:hypothetical protein [Lachnospiraceae bacterium]